MSRRPAAPAGDEEPQTQDMVTEPPEPGAGLDDADEAIRQSVRGRAGRRTHRRIPVAIGGAGAKGSDGDAEQNEPADRTYPDVPRLHCRAHPPAGTAALFPLYPRARCQPSPTHPRARDQQPSPTPQLAQAPARRGTRPPRAHAVHVEDLLPPLSPSQGLSALVKERPANPVEFLAAYLMQNNPQKA